MSDKLYKKEKIVIIGGGVSGLTTAICLKEAGYDVVIIADKFESDITSNVAGALWEWPPAVCGKHGEPRSLSRSKKWGMKSYEKFKQLDTIYSSEETGIYLRDVYFYFKYKIADKSSDLLKMNELKEEVDGFERGIHIIPDSINKDFQGGIKDAYKHMAPMIDTDVYMKWLFSFSKDIGCEIVQMKIESNIILDEKELLKRFKASAIVNCAGLGSIITTGDNSMYPLRGALVRVENTNGIIKSAHCISHDDTSTDEQDIVFIVPRGNENTVILGGLAQMNQWKDKMSLKDSIIKQMYDNCLDFAPDLKKLPLDSLEPVRTGLRPFTEKNVCVEKVPNSKILYNYGHGGAGITLSWGCALEIVDYVNQTLKEKKGEFEYSCQQRIDSGKKTCLILQDMLSMKVDLQHISKLNTNVVLLCSRRGLSKITPSQYEYIDYLEIVEDYSLEELVARFLKIQNIFKIKKENCSIVTNDEYSVLFAAQMREVLNINGNQPKSIEPFTNKTKLRNALNNSSIRLPKTIEFDPSEYQSNPELYLSKIINTIGLPIFVKPSVGAGSEKTSRIHDVEQLRVWCEKHTLSKDKFELNEYISGRLFNTSLVLYQGKVIYFAPCRHFCPNDEFIYGNPIGNIIVREEDKEYTRLLEFSVHALQNLKFDTEKSGVFNLDFYIQDDTDEIILLEIAARPPGGLVSKMFSLYQGVYLQELHLQLQVGYKPQLKIKPKQEQLFSAYIIYPKRKGVVKEITKPIFNSKCEITWQISPEQQLENSESMRDVAIAILLSNKNYIELENDYQKAHVESYYKQYDFEAVLE